MPFAPIGNSFDRQHKIGKQQKPGADSLDTLVVEVAVEVLKEIYGEEESMHAKPLFLKNRTLTVTCSSQEMAQEIRENQKNIVDKINDKLGKKEVDRIRYLA